MHRTKRFRLTVAMSALAVSSMAHAQADGSLAQEVADEAASEAIPTSEEIVVQGQIRYRNRIEGPEPILSYGSDYFQRFEPLTAGDALKRVPGVTFLSDVLESDGARLRGLDPGYTQILINGEKVPGSNVDRSFFLDRIPAELLDRVEIVRSSSARRSGDAVAGSLNIVLRDGFELDGGYAKVGGLLFDGGEVKPSLGVVWGGAVGPGRLLLGGNLQGRHNPKKKKSFRYGDSPENDPDYETKEFDTREDQSDTRDGTDYALNATYSIDGENTDIEIGGFYVHTDRTEQERSLEYSAASSRFPALPLGADAGDVPALLADGYQFEDIKQDNYALSGKIKHRWSLGETGLKLGFARFDEDIEGTELEIAFDNDEDPASWEGVRTRQDIQDREFSLQLDHGFELGRGIKLVVGGFYQDKDRDTDIRAAEDDDDLSEAFRNAYDPSSQSPDDLPASFDEFEPVIGGLSTIEEQRRDLFVLIEGKTGIATWEAGVRYETTRVKIDDLEIDTQFRQKFDFVLPSASLKLALTPNDRVNLSVARTNRRARFDYLSPALLEEEFGDHDLIGNPDLKPETAWGVDVGYERKIGRTGVAGVNLFYRKITNLVEIADTGIPGSNDETIFQPRNTGTGTVRGVEFDLSTSLTFLGLPDTGIFGNFAYLDSKVKDELGSRRFNGQPKYVYNFGFIQDIRSAGAAFGATYRKQGVAYERVVSEEVRTTYGADLELFVEKRFGKWLTVRAVGSNLLNAAKEETFNKFDTIGDQIDREFDEYEIETEKAGPVFQLIARAAF